MKAVYYEAFGQPLSIRDLPDPTPDPDGVVIRVEASGLCRSDWHGWMGHDTDIRLPHVPGHELAGVVEEVGKAVRDFRTGDRVTLPFCCGCGDCPQCRTGNQQICDDYFQPGFTAWGSFAQYVAIRYADTNLVRLPEALDFVTAASLGCRFITSYRALMDQARVEPGQWVAVHGCGGIGLSAVMIARAAGAQALGIDIDAKKLTFAKSVGASHVLDAAKEADLAEAIAEITGGGAHVSMDALGSPVTCGNSVACLRKRGLHLQVGLLNPAEGEPAFPVGPIVAKELRIAGSHGMQAHRYPELLAMIQAGALDPRNLIGKTLALEEVLRELPAMGSFPGAGIAVIDRF